MHIQPKKRLGQNFLTDKNIQRKIVENSNFQLSDTILEIGAGRGELTQVIAEKVSQVYAFEIDSDLCRILKNNLKGCQNVKIINQDILKSSLGRYFNKLKHKIKVIGNIPYYITTPIIEHLLIYRKKIDTIFITVQKEFAKRIVASSGSKDYGSFSCFMQFYTNPQIRFFIKKNSFFPIPKVDSCFLQLEIRRKLSLKPQNEKLVFKIIRAAFNKRRKTLRNSLKDIVPQKKLQMFFDKYNIDSNTRPEKLSLADFANLTTI